MLTLSSVCTVVKELETRALSSGSTLRIIVASVRPYNSVDPIWLNLCFWDDRFSRMYHVLRKGALLYVSGSLYLRIYEHKRTGEHRNHISVNIDALHLIKFAPRDTIPLAVDGEPPYDAAHEDPVDDDLAEIPF